MDKRERYDESYDKFIKWRTDNNIEESFSETTLLQYFTELSRTMQPTSLIYMHSTLKSAIIKKHDINIQSYMRLKNFLKKQSEGYQSKKSKVFTAQEVDTFLTEAPDNEYLAVKVALIFGICGGISGFRFFEINIENVTKHNEMFLVKLPPSKHIKNAQTEQAFVIRENLSPLVQKYIELRPDDLQTNRFFLGYHHGKCHRQHIGRTIFSAMPATIAKYLNLPDPNCYTGHCFRRTSQKLRSCTGSELALIKKLGGNDHQAGVNEQVGAHQNISIMDSIDPVVEMSAATTSTSNNDLSTPYDTNQQNDNRVRIKALQLWEDLTEALSNGTVERSGNETQWRKVWTDLKNTTKRKVRMMTNNNADQLTDFDQRVLKIIEKEINAEEGAQWNGVTDIDQSSNHLPLDDYNIFEEESADHWNAPSASDHTQQADNMQKYNPLAKWKTFLNDKDGLFEAKPADNDSDDEPLAKKSKTFVKTKIKVEDNKSAKINGRAINDGRKMNKERLELERDRIRIREAEMQLQGKWNELMMDGMRVLHKYIR